MSGPVGAAKRSEYTKRTGFTERLWIFSEELTGQNFILNPTDLHRSLTETDILDDALCWQEDRTVSNILSIQSDRVIYLLEPGVLTNDLRRKRVTVFSYPDGTVAIRYGGVSLPYSAFEKIGKIK